MPHRNYSSTASRTTISATISPSDTTLSVASLTGYPAPPFTAAIDRGNASEELVTVTAVAGNSVTITRGVDGSAAKTHSAQAAFEHVTSARDFKDATSVTSTDGQAYDSARLGGMSAPLYLLTSDANAAYVVRDEAKTATVAASETTTSTIYVELATSGPAVNAIKVGPSGRCLVLVGGGLQNNGANNYALMSFDVSGPTASVATDDRSFAVRSAVAGQEINATKAVILTGLAPGDYTFNAKYRVTAGTGTFIFRHIHAIPL